MKKQSLILAAIVMTSIFVLYSCKEDNNNPNADQFNSLSEIVEALKTAPQTFTISNPSMAQTITGEDGTVFNMQANSFLDVAGNVITNPISIELNEYLTLADMIRGNAETISNGQLLVTGGSFDFTAKDVNGDDTFFAPGAISAQIPIQTDISGYENSMQYYEGERFIEDEKERVNWTLSGNQQVSMDDTVGIFTITGLSPGLVNCDALFQLAGETGTQFEMTVAGETNYDAISGWIIIDDFPTIIPIVNPNDEGTALKTFEGLIPLGMTGSLLAIHGDEDGYLKFGSLPITVAGDDSFELSTDYGTIEELQVLISSLTN